MTRYVMRQQFESILRDAGLSQKEAPHYATLLAVLVEVNTEHYQGARSELHDLVIDTLDPVRIEAIYRVRLVETACYYLNHERRL